MERQKTELSEMLLVGLTARTNNQNEMNPGTSRIAGLTGLYWGNQVAEQIAHRVSPEVTYSVYTEFENDESGDYTYFIGEVVSSFEGQDLSQFQTLIIPRSDYQKFTTESGQMPEVVIDAWQTIWAMDEADIGGKRKYIADFEIYDQRASDIRNAVLDIYIGIQS